MVGKVSAVLAPPKMMADLLSMMKFFVITKDDLEYRKKIDAKSSDAVKAAKVILTIGEVAIFCYCLYKWCMSDKGNNCV